MMIALSLAVVLGFASGAEPSAPVTEPVRRFALVVGANDGGGDRLTLRYAVADARAFHRVLVELGGVREGDAALVVEPTHESLRQALQQAAQQVGAARARGERPELIVYYSGHSDETGLLLGGAHFDYVDLRRAIEAMNAELRVVVLDSCASGELTRTKGVVRRPAFLSDVARVRGHAFLTSSSADESAQESDAIGASFFTHYLVTGMRGAADVGGDGRVSLTEAYQFAFHETLARTERTSLGGQHPAYAVDLAGTGDVVLTDLMRAESTLVLPAESAGRISVRQVDDERLVAELRKLRGSATELALAAGHYSVFIERGAQRWLAHVELRPGARVLVDDSALVPVETEPATPRGPSAAELAQRAQERERAATVVYEREKLRVEAPRDIFDRGPFLAYAGDVAVPLAHADFFDRAGRPDLMKRHDENIATKAWLRWGGLGFETVAAAATVVVVLGVAATAPAGPLAIGTAITLATVVGGGFTLVLVGAVVGLVGSSLEAVPATLEEARAIADAHNRALRRRLRLPALAIDGMRSAP